MLSRILIVDDSPLVRKLLRKCFESEPGLEVCAEAADGKEGIEKARECHPDLILLDLSMPVMNGLEAAKALNGSMPSIPLIMFTNYNTSNLQQEALAVGISKVIVKTDPLADLITCVRSLLVKHVA